jgi:RNA polymerase sigma factor (TIGR02999 family)
LGDITALLERANQGDLQARNELFEQVYSELSRLARQKLGWDAAYTNLNAASLVHEACLRLMVHRGVPGENRLAFFTYAASVMRSVIIDYVRQRGANKRGGAKVHVTLTSNEPEEVGTSPDVETLDSALQQLAGIDARAHQIVEMRYFGGLSIEEIAQALEISPATVKRDWQKARAFLYQQLQTRP